MQTIEEIITSFKTTPILFVGSGLTRRYLNLPNWDGLLSHFANRMSKDSYIYAGYKNSANQDMPYTATLIEADFNRRWFSDSAFREELPQNYLDQIRLNGLSPFKAEIANYLNSFKEPNPLYETEINKLSSLMDKHISGIITTNYDCFMENICPKYTVYTGQDELLFSPIQNIAELYKIHGSTRDPKTIIINQDDYAYFEEHSAYLAAKLLTLFVEYPIIFIGYSIQDKNIQTILSNIIKCLNLEQLEELRHRFIFIQHAHSIEEEDISTVQLKIDDKSLVMTKISLFDYSKLYDALQLKHRAVPVNLLRIFKNEFYNYTITNSPNSAIMSVAELDNPNIPPNALMVAIGTEYSLRPIGLIGKKAADMYKDILLNNLKFSSDVILRYAYPEWKRQNVKLPVFKYLATASKAYPNIQKENTVANFDSFFLTDSIVKTRENTRKHIPTKNIASIAISDINDYHKITYMCNLYKEEIDATELKKFLVSFLTNHPNLFVSDGKDVVMKTNFKRLIRIYDWLIYGQKK